ncbi:MAG TPA: putative baseplate assembly protein [Allosphingosinicella sp.]|nr:putative baseplate assembly protein [Allosphingosinicella sp.]
MRFHCCDLRRLEVIRKAGSANGIEFLEVLDLAAPTAAPRQQTLFVRLLAVPPVPLTPDNLRITGGERIRDVGIVWCAMADQLPPSAEPGLAAGVDLPALTLVIRTDSSGDHSTYSLSILAGSGSLEPPAGFDPVLSSVRFSFKIECPNDFDCAPALICPPEAPVRPDIDYLARDYQTLRRLMLDRLSLLSPGWTERSPADLGVALVELLAYAADNLSYRQDAVANEAYLATARQRISVHRHTRLVDYGMHEGCNARAFVHFEVAAGQSLTLPKGTQLLSRVASLGNTIAVVPGSRELDDALAQGPLVFETALDVALDGGLNRFDFYTWGDEACCLPRGSTRATLRGHHPLLKPDGIKPNAILVFEERLSPTTLQAADRDLAHRWAVRLTEAELSSDPSGRLFDSPAAAGAVAVTEIAWDAADALPFSLCLSVAERPGEKISVALGNIVLADHGQTIPPAPLGTMPEHRLELAGATPDSCCDKPERIPVPPRFRPVLAKAPVSQGFGLDQMLAVPFGTLTPWWPASALLAIDPRCAMPRFAGLTGQLGTLPAEDWKPRRDLLSSRAYDRHFVVEVDDNARAHLRFGDDQHGKRPDPGTVFTVSYRIGNGQVGNVGADAIAHVVSGASGVFTAIRNPMPAAGGVDPEEVEAVRRDAPQAFRTQKRAVTASDYAEAAERYYEVQGAFANFRWTGSWRTVFVSADRFGGGPIDAAFRARLRHQLESVRMAGYDLNVVAPRFVPLDIELHVCARTGYFRSEVLKRVGQVLSSAALPDGSLGLFHPDRLEFGAPVYLSRIIAAAQAVEGVDSVHAVRFRRLVDPDPLSLELGVIEIGAIEIAQQANNPTFPERGTLHLSGGGGK